MSQKAKIRFGFFVVASLSIALIISLIIGICFFASLRKKENVGTVDRYKLSIGIVDTKKTTTNVYRVNIVRNGVMCTDFSQISEKCGYTMMVSGNEIRFYLNNNDNDLLILETGKDVAYLNSNPVHLSVPMYKIGENVYLPIDFINNYFSGISVTVNTENATIVIEYIDPKKCALKLKAPQINDAFNKALFPDE